MKQKRTELKLGIGSRRRTMAFRQELIECLENKYHTSFEGASNTEMYKAVATVINQQLVEKR